MEDGTLVAIEVEGVRGDRFAIASDKASLDRADAEISGGSPPGGVAPAATLLAPLDPFVWDRGLLRGLYGFDYVWEVYVPESKRRWGYYVLPILYGDRIVGRIEPRIDRKTGALRVIGAWSETWFDEWDSEEFSDALARALDAHRRFADLRRIVVPRRQALRPLAQAVRRLDLD